jgi:hypothetical protein
MASRQGPLIKVEGPWKRASFYRVSLSHCRKIKELAFSVFGGWGWKRKLADGIFGVDDAIMGGIECYWWKFWRRLRALTEQLPRPVALAGGFEVPTGGSALSWKINASIYKCSQWWLVFVLFFWLWSALGVAWPAVGTGVFLFKQVALRLLCSQKLKKIKNAPSSKSQDKDRTPQLATFTMHILSHIIN